MDDTQASNDLVELRASQLSKAQLDTTYESILSGCTTLLLISQEHQQTVPEAVWPVALRQLRRLHQQLSMQ